nr:hypothetical protein [Enterococcus sp. 665A]
MLKNQFIDGKLYIENLPVTPIVLDEQNLNEIRLMVQDQEHNITLEKHINNLEERLNILEDQIKKRVQMNSDKKFESLSVEIELTQKEINRITMQSREANTQLELEKQVNKKLSDSLDILKRDIQNNKDAKKLIDLGSNEDISVYQKVCPTCHQQIEDSLIEIDSHNSFMSIEENIAHLISQKELFEYNINLNSKKINILEREISFNNEKLYKLNKLLRVLKRSINDYSKVTESDVYKKIQLDSEIERLEVLLKNFFEQRKKLLKISTSWKEYLEAKNNLPVNKYSESDLGKIHYFESVFINKLNLYGYTSVNKADIGNIKISRENFMPITENFDMKFDSSASDNIRAIWAYTMSLFIASRKFGNNHPGIIIFDEPDQQSIIPKDMLALLKDITKLGDKIQVIIGITVKDTETIEIIESLSVDLYDRTNPLVNRITLLENYAFRSEEEPDTI